MSPFFPICFLFFGYCYIFPGVSIFVYFIFKQEKDQFVRILITLGQNHRQVDLAYFQLIEILTKKFFQHGNFDHSFGNNKGVSSLELLPYVLIVFF